MTRELLESKRGTLEELERSELEAQRLEKALERVRIVGDDGGTERAVPRESTEAAAPLPPLPTSSAPRRSGGGLLGALSHTFHGIVDVDPEATRRNTITKTRELINQVSRHSFFDVSFPFELTLHLHTARSRSQSPHPGPAVRFDDHPSRLGPLPTSKGRRPQGDVHRLRKVPSRVGGKGEFCLSFLCFPSETETYQRPLAEPVEVGGSQAGHRGDRYGLTREGRIIHNGLKLHSDLC